MLIAVLLLCSGIDMIGDMSSRITPGKEPIPVETVIPEEEVECVKPKGRMPLINKLVSANKEKAQEKEDAKEKEVDTKPEEVDIKPEESDTKPEEIDTKSEVSDTKVEEGDTKVEDTDTKTDTKTDTSPEETSIPFPEDDKLEPGEKEVEAKDDSEAGYKYYVYRSHNCDPCRRLVKELQKNVDEKDLILSYERTTKSGKYIWYVPVLEVYKDGKLVHQQTGYTRFESIKKHIDEAN